MVLPKFIRQAVTGESLTIHGDGRQSRCFCYVGDTVQALVELASGVCAGQIVNVGTDDSTEIVSLAELVLRATGSHSKAQFNCESGFAEIKSRMPDVSKVKELIGWQARTDIAEIVEKTVNYMAEGL